MVALLGLLLFVGASTAGADPPVLTGDVGLGDAFVITLC